MTTSDFDAVAVKLAGVFGAVVSMRFLQGSWLSRASMAFGGAFCSYFAARYVAQRVGIPEGLSGFLLGLFGMAIISRAWEWVQSTPVAAFWQIVLDGLKKKLGL